METVLTHPTIKLNAIPDVFEEKIRQLESMLEQSNLTHPVYRLEIPIEPADILSWLSVQSSPQTIYWSNREGTFEVGGVGTCASFISNELDYSKLLKETSKNITPKFPHLRYYGGCAFHPQNMAEEWQEFNTCQFWIPAFEVVNASNQSYFCCNIVIRKNIKNALKKILKDFKKIKFTQLEVEEGQALLTRRDFPNQMDWLEAFPTVQKKFRKGTLKKVVLARKTVFKLKKKLNIFNFLKDLRAITPNCFHFCFQPESGIGFTGASPERLYLRDKRLLKTEAIAGTRSRSEEPEEDASLEKELRDSEKDRQEHLFVVEFIQEALKKICKESTGKKLDLLKLQEGMHLLSEFEGNLKENISDEEILNTLHPTPAVAGTPTEEAVKAIKFWEPFSRGWYTGIIGYLGVDSSEFAVGIRCGLVRKNIISVFSGAGIVKDSDPEKEWQEIENKISGFLKILQK